MLRHPDRFDFISEASPENVIKTLWVNGVYFFDEERELEEHNKRYQEYLISLERTYHPYGQESKMERDYLTKLNQLMEWKRRFDGQIPLDWVYPNDDYGRHIIYALLKVNTQLPEQLVEALLQYPSIPLEYVVRSQKLTTAQLQELGKRDLSRADTEFVEEHQRRLGVPQAAISEFIRERASLQRKSSTS